MTVKVKFNTLNKLLMEEPFQIIDGNMKLPNNLDKIFCNNDVENLIFFYTIAIIGAQGTGKTTLINYLYDTKLKVPLESGERTTVGIWAQIIERAQVLLLDSEGSDWSIRENEETIDGTSQDTFERVIACFSLTFSNILMINIKWDEVDTSGGSCYSLFKNIAQSYKNFYEGSNVQKKLIILVLRDYIEAIHKELPEEIIKDN